MSRYFLLTFCVICCAGILCAQSAGGNLAPPDTFTTYKYQYLSVVKSFDTTGVPFDTIANPACVLVDTHFAAQYSWCIAVAKPEGYVVFNPFENFENYPDTSGMRIECVDVDGKKQKELVIRWTRTWGHHAYVYGVDVYEEGVLIIDLDHLTQLMHYQNVTSSSMWQNYDVIDSADSSTTETITQTEEHWENYRVTAGKKSLAIQMDCRYGEMENGEKAVCDETVYRYRWTGQGFIRKK